MEEVVHETGTRPPDDPVETGYIAGSAALGKLTIGRRPAFCYAADFQCQWRMIYVEKALIKIARQLRSLDEASLMSLWERYAEIVRSFEPSERWEEAVLVLSFIQNVRMKNQLFNHHWAGAHRPQEPLRVETAEVAILEAESPRPEQGIPRAVQACGGNAGRNAGRSSDIGPARRSGIDKRGKLIRFRARDEG